MKLLHKIVLIHLFLTGTAYAQQENRSSYTLKQSIELALANNMQSAQSELQVQSAAINLKQAKANLLPGLSANIGHGSNQGRSIDPFTNAYSNRNIDYANYSLNGGITLFSGLILRNQVKQSVLAYRANQMEQQQARDNLTLDVILAYFQVLNTEDQLKQAELQAETSRKQVERSKLLSKEGAIAPAQLSDLMGQLANDELSIINSRNALNSSRIALARLMNVNYERDFKVERLSPDAIPPNTEMNPDKIYQQALEQLALVKGTVLRKESAKKGVQVARGGSYPQLSLNSNVFSNYSSAAQTSKVISTQDVSTTEYVELNGSKLPVMAQQRSTENSKIPYNNQIRNNYSSSISIGVRMPIFNGWKTRNQIAQAQIEVNNAELAEETIKLQLKQAVDLAWFNMAAASEKLQTLGRQVSFFNESFKAAEVRFNAGVGTFVDYTIAKNNLDRANLNLINARYDYLLRSKVLDYYQGRLTY